jgi:hypothetical protein
MHDKNARNVAVEVAMGSKFPPRDRASLAQGERRALRVVADREAVPARQRDGRDDDPAGCTDGLHRGLQLCDAHVE